MSAGAIEVISPPALPRKRRNSEATAAVHHPENPYKRIYYEPLDSFFNAIKEIFDQSTFKLFTQSNCLWKRWASAKLQMSWRYWRHISNVTMIPIHSLQSFHLLPTIFKCKPINLEEVKVLKSLSREKKTYWPGIASPLEQLSWLPALLLQHLRGPSQCWKGLKLGCQQKNGTEKAQFLIRLWQQVHSW